jgi:hypothetical protein
MPANIDEAVSSRQGAHHQSSLETILDGCSWQYYLSYIRELPQPPKPHALAGTSFHTAVELHERARMAGTPLPTMQQMTDCAAEVIMADVDRIPPQLMVGKYDEPWDADTLIDMAGNAVHNWYSARLKDGSKPHREWLLDFEPVAVEPYFNLKLVEDAAPIGGWIDGVYRRPTGELLLVDQKTAGDFSRWHQDGEGHRYQATMYGVALVLSDDFPEVTELDGLEMHYLVSRTRGGQVERARRVVVTPQLDDVALLGNRIRQVEQIIKTNNFAPNPAWNLCSPRFCAFYEGCQITGDLRKAPPEFVARYHE